MTTFTTEQRQQIADYMAQNAVKVVGAAQFFLIQERHEGVVVFWRTYRAFGAYEDDSHAFHTIGAAVHFVEQSLSGVVSRIELYR